MKKFRVVEKSRFLGNDELSRIQGGCFWNYITCSPTHLIEACSRDHTIACGDVVAAVGYSSCGLLNRQVCNGTYQVEIIRRHDSN